MIMGEQLTHCLNLASLIRKPQHMCTPTSRYNNLWSSTAATSASASIAATPAISISDSDPTTFQGRKRQDSLWPFF